MEPSEPSLREEVAELRRAVAESREELMAHRQALTQCLEVRETVEVLVGEVRDRMQELEFSLAGVSDNTSRHGKALSALAEQRKRTGATLDAIVRAVKRLARQRSRSREGTSGRRTPLSAHAREALAIGEVRATGGEVESDAPGDAEASAPEDALGSAMLGGAHADFERDIQWDDWPMAIAEADARPALLSGPAENMRSSGRRRSTRSHETAAGRRPGSAFLARIEGALKSLDEGAGAMAPRTASWMNSPVTSASEAAPGQVGGARSSSARGERRAQH